MADIDGWKDVLADAQRRVWPKVAEAVAGTGGVLMGGTAVAIHLRHRTSVDLDVMSLEAFSGRMVAGRLERLSSDVQIEEAADSCLRAIVDGVPVDVFRALGTEEASPDEMSMIQHGPVIDGMPVDSTRTLNSSGVSTTTASTRIWRRCSRTRITSEAIGALLDR